MLNRSKKENALPGFQPTLGLTLLYLSLIVLIPLAALILKVSDVSLSEFWSTIIDPRLLASYKLSFGLSLFAAAINVPLGLLLSWVIYRYSFPGRDFMNVFIDLPFALPTAVAGLSLSALYNVDGWIGHWLAPYGIRIAYTPLGIFVAFLFIGLPFTVCTLQPLLENLDRRKEEAAETLGASPGVVFIFITLPQLRYGLITGFALAFARAVGEYGSVIFIAGNIPLVSEITPLMIISRLEQYDYKGATAIALVMLFVSLGILLIISSLQYKKMDSCLKES